MPDSKKIGEINKGLIGNLSEAKLIEKRYKEIEFAFRSLLELSPIYIFFKDHEIRPLFLSRNYEEMLHMPLKNILGRTMDELFPSELAKNMIADDKKILEEGKIVSVDEELHGRYYTTIKFPIHLENENPMLAGFTIDITDRTIAQMALKESENELRELNAMKDKMFSIIAHDLRNPFNIILSHSDLLSKDYNSFDDEERIEMIKSIKSASQQTYGLLQNLLTWTRSQLHNINYKYESINVKEQIREVAEIYNHIAADKEIDIVCDIDDDLHMYVDKDTIEIILRNLISNAIKFSYKKNSIVIKAEKLAQEKNYVKISVVDNGIGIPEERLDQIFSLQMASTYGTEKEKGTGLGLALCKEFVENNKGKIGVESIPDKETCFWILIPINQADDK